MWYTVFYHAQERLFFLLVLFFFWPLFLIVMRICCILSFNLRYKLFWIVLDKDWFLTAQLNVVHPKFYFRLWKPKGVTWWVNKDVSSVWYLFLFHTLQQSQSDYSSFTEASTNSSSFEFIAWCLSKQYVLMSVTDVWCGSPYDNFSVLVSLNFCCTER